MGFLVEPVMLSEMSGWNLRCHRHRRLSQTKSAVVPMAVVQAGVIAQCRAGIYCQTLLRVVGTEDR